VDGQGDRAAIVEQGDLVAVTGARGQHDASAVDVGEREWVASEVLGLAG